MKENDMLAFESWLNDNWDPKTDPVVRCAQSAWEAACEFKQKEIDELQSENAKLRDCVEFYSVNGLSETKSGTIIDTRLTHEFYLKGRFARQVLKELDGK